MPKVDTSERDRLRERLFSSKTFKSKVISLFGQKVEVRQPSVEQILAFQGKEDTKEIMIQIMVEYLYVPNSDIRVFDKSDMASIMGWPMGDWFTVLNDAVSELTNIDVGEASKN